MMSILGGRVIVLPRARCWHLPATHLIVCQVILSIVNENIGTTAIQLHHSLFPTSMRMRGCSACIYPRKMLAMHLHYCGCVGYFMPFCAYFLDHLCLVGQARWCSGKTMLQLTPVHSATYGAVVSHENLFVSTPQLQQ